MYCCPHDEVTRVQSPFLTSLSLLDAQILPGGFGNTTYRIRATGRKARRDEGQASGQRGLEMELAGDARPLATLRDG